MANTDPSFENRPKDDGQFQASDWGRSISGELAANDQRHAALSN
jgi:hypothetical protein